MAYTIAFDGQSFKPNRRAGTLHRPSSDGLGTVERPFAKGTRRSVNSRDHITFGAVLEVTDVVWTLGYDEVGPETIDPKNTFLYDSDGIRYMVKDVVQSDIALNHQLACGTLPDRRPR
jgi:hypothetical protein